MNSYIVPLRINGRRTFFLALAGEAAEQEQQESFVLEIPDAGSSFTVVQLFGNEELRTLVLGGQDRYLRHCDTACTYDEHTGNLTLRITLPQTPHPDGVANSSKVVGGRAPVFSIKVDDGDVCIHAAIPAGAAGAAPAKPTKLDVKFQDELGSLFSGSLLFYFAPKNAFVQCGLDFGSEASQLEEQHYIKHGTSWRQAGGPVNLFNTLRNYKNVMDDRDNFVQYEPDTPYLKSVFFIKSHLTGTGTFIESKNELNLLTRKKEFDDSNFLREWKQLPNLKLAHKHENILDDGDYTIPDKAGTGKKIAPFAKIRERAYASILKEIFAAYFKERLEDSDSNHLYFRITLLVPNIYEASDIAISKGVIREIVAAVNAETGSQIAGVEIQALSESDASFLGHFNRGLNAIARSAFYLIIDCGKGTTDFSIVKTGDSNAHEIKPVYRNGFAGAGNLISFAFFETLVHRFVLSANSRDNALKFFSEQLEKTDTQKRRDLFDLIEHLKREYNPSSESAVDSAWSRATNGQLNAKNILDNGQADITPLTTLAKTAGTLRDWGGYIADAIEQIAGNTVENLEQVLTRIDPKLRCAGILLTGRAFLFAPLRKELEKKLGGIERLKGVRTTFSDEPKSVCMKGIFMPGIVTHSESNGTPVPVQAPEEPAPLTGQASTSTAPRPEGGRLRKTWTTMRDTLQDLFTTEDELGENTTISGKLEGKDFSRLKLYIGSTLYKVANADFYEPKDTTDSDYIFTNSGYKVRAFDSNKKLKLVSPLAKDSDLMEKFSAPLVIPSLFPVKLKVSALQSLKREYPAASKPISVTNPPVPETTHTT